MNKSTIGYATLGLFLVGVVFVTGLYQPFLPAACSYKALEQCFTSTTIFGGNQNINVGYGLIVAAIALQALLGRGKA